MKIILLISAMAMLSACATTTPQHWNRAHGEEYKFYPFEEGSASRYAEQGRKCWLDSNRENWDQCL